MIEAQQLTSLLAIADKAIEADRLEREAKHAASDLNDAYDDYKAGLSIDYVERGTPAWDEMMEHSKAEYDASENAKRLAKNAKRRLQSAIQRHREGGAA
jgi:hypothetical protein